MDPNIAYILMMLGFYGLLFELQNPGAILPGVVGGICLILAFLALSTLPVNYAGVALIVLAIAFFLAEIKVVSHGLLATGGVVSLVLGSMILFQGEGARLSWAIIVGATGGDRGLLPVHRRQGAGGAAPPGRDRPPRAGRAARGGARAPGAGRAGALRRRDLERDAASRKWQRVRKSSSRASRGSPSACAPSKEG